jgi:YHS domain-containing protein
LHGSIGRNDAPHAAGARERRGTAVAADGPTEARMTKCAVCEKSLKKADAPSKTTHLGVAYYFCSETCEKKFETHRAEYTHKHATA